MNPIQPPPALSPVDLDLTPSVPLAGLTPDVVAALEDPTLPRLAEWAAWSFQVPRVRVVLWGDGAAHCVAHWGEAVPNGPAIDGLVAGLLRERGYCVVPDLTAMGDTAGPAVSLGGVRFMAAVTLTDQNGVPVGSFCLLGSAVRQMTDQEARMLTQLAAVAVEHLALRSNARRVVLMHAELEQRHGWMMESASQDALTQVANRRALMAFLDKTLSLARREGHPVSVVLFDMRGFKAINQRFGDTVGDRVLCEVAVRLAACMRGSELVGRMSGDEFMAVLYPCSAEQAVLAAERYALAGSVEPIALAAADGMTVKVEIATGACTAHEQQTSDELYRLAARALDAAKGKAPGQPGSATRTPSV